MARPKRDQFSLDDLGAITPGLDELFEIQKLTIWGAVAVVMDRLEIDRSIVDDYIRAINNAEFEALTGQSCALELKGWLDVDGGDREDEDTFVQCFDVCDGLDDFLELGPTFPFLMSWDTSEEAILYLEDARRTALHDMNFPAMVYHALVSDILSSKPSFKSDTVLGLGDGYTITINRTQLGKADKFYESHVGKVLRLAVNRPVEVKAHGLNTEYQLIGLFARLLCSFFPSQFEKANRPNVAKLVELITQNLNSSNCDDFIKDRSLKQKVSFGLGASQTLFTKQPIKVGRKVLNREGIDLTNFLKSNSAVPSLKKKSD